MNMKKYVSKVTGWMVISCLFTGFIGENTAFANTYTETDYNSKISSELKAVMETCSEDDTVPVYLWLDDISYDDVNTTLKDNGYDPAIYDQPEKFDTIVSEKVRKEVIDEVGITLANENLSDSDISKIAGLQNYLTDSLTGSETVEGNVDVKNTLIDRAVSNEMDNYIIEKRNIIKDESEELNERFIKNNVEAYGDKVLHDYAVARAVVVDADYNDIIRYAKLDEVLEVSLYKDTQWNAATDTAMEQINADCLTGTKSHKYNNGTGYYGSGVKVGIIEYDGKFDKDSPLLSNIMGNSLNYVCLADNYHGYSDPWVSISDHATMVTGMIVGQSQDSNHSYAGVVPNATVYQASMTNLDDIVLAIDLLAARGVSVINLSAGYVDYNNPGSYLEVDRLIDLMTYKYGMTFVCSAGNKVYDIYSKSYILSVNSPGKAFNVITVGNAATKSDAHTAIDTNVFSMDDSSSYKENSYLPNKPDISAPGTNITSLLSNGVVMCGTGTSFSAPLVTGVVAQMMEANVNLKNNPTMVKSKLLASADVSKISTENNPLAADNSLRDKSGIGFLDAVSAVKNALSGDTRTCSISLLTNANDPKVVKSCYLNKGAKVRAVMVYDNNGLASIDTGYDMNDLDIWLEDTDTGDIVVSTESGRNNVEVLEYTVEEAGNYRFVVNPYKKITTKDTEYGELHCAITFEIK